MRKTEKVTLHFDLSHLPAHHEFTLKAHGRQVRLKRHDADSRRHHAAGNAALALLVEGELEENLTHYTEDVELPSDAVSFNWVGYESTRPGAVSDEIGVVFQYIPRASMERAVRAMQRDGELETAATLAHLGASATKHPDPMTLHRDARVFINYKDTALTLLMQHPEIGTADPVNFARIKDMITKQMPSFDQVWQYLSRHSAATSDPWYENTYVKDLDGNAMEPAPDLTDSEGQPVQWPTVAVGDRSVGVIPQFQLSDGLNDVLGAAVNDAGTLIKNKSWLKGRQWSTQHGLTQLSRTEVVPVVASTGAPAQAQWTIANKTSTYGLDLYQDSMRFDATSNTMTFCVKNWPNRGLGAYVQFLDPDDNPIADPQGWTERLPASLRGGFQPSASKKYLQYIGAGSTFYGIPVWAPQVPISFAVPEAAVGAKVLVGGLGHGHWDMDVVKLGVIYTCCVSYGIPSLLSVLSVGVQSTKWYMDFFADPDNVAALASAASTTFAPLFALGAATIGIEATLVKAARFVAGILFSKLLKTLALKITGYVTAQQLIQNAPFVGWALKVASQACAIADMIATSIEVGLSPATYELQLKRSMTLNVSVTPDPTHGGAQPIWPKSSDHYVIQVQYAGGTTLLKTGPMPARADAPIEVCYSTATNDALPSAAGQKFQIIANIYAADNSLCGKWVSGWIEAVPTDGNSRNEAGAIIEQLVPLVATTRYVHESKLRYDGARKSYLWEKTGTPPAQTATGLSDTGVQKLVDLTINDLAGKLGYCFQADRQNLPLDYRTAPTSSTMYVFQSISTSAAPGKGMLAPTRGFSVQPCIAYDQFGPAGLFTLDPANSYQPDLDKGGTVTGDLRNAFAAQGFPLAADWQVTVLKAGASWQIGPTGMAKYDLRRQTDVIKVFTAPVPDFSPNNFYLDTRTYEASGVSHLRLVDLSDKAGTTFDYGTTKSWGAFALATVDDIVIHPNGYAIAINYENNKLAILQLPEAGVADQDAPQALPFCGSGEREGLLGGPTATTVAADGRILVLEMTNARIQAFDTYANPVQCFATKMAFELPAGMVDDFNHGAVSPALLQTLQKRVPVQRSSTGAVTDTRYLLAPAFSMPASFAGTLDAGTVTDDLRSQFEAHTLTLDAQATILPTAKGIWLVQNPSDGMNFDIRLDGEGNGEVDVYRCFTPTILVKAPNSEWLMMDKTNTLSFEVTAPAGTAGPLQCRNMTSLLALKDPPSPAVKYLDVAVEAKGFIYVLSCVNDGKAPSDYRLDIYKPDGSPLTTDAGRHNGQINAPRMIVDQWRTLFTLNYQQMEGPAGRPEPTVSQWIPS